jgi:hypothetical protein
MARRHIFDTVKKAARGGDSSEPIHERYAWLGLVLGMGFMIGFSWVAGMTLGIAAVFFVLFMFYMIGLTRIRSEGGTIWHFGPYINPPGLLVHLLGSRMLRPNNLTILAYLEWFNLEFRCAGMPHQLEGFRIARDARIRLRSMFMAIVLATIVGIIAAYWNVLRMYYIKGAATPHVNLWRTNMGLRPYFRLRAWLDYPSSGSFDSIPYLAVGMLGTFLLMFLRTHFLWWPFHPLGYAVGHSFIIDLIWMPMCISWILKKLILQYGGIQAYRGAMPFFIGLLLGDYVIACLFSIAGVVLDIPMYRVFPN